MPKAPKIIIVHWPSLRPTWLKFNTDGAASKSLGIAGGGSIARNCCRFAKWSAANPFGHLYAFEAELLAVICAL